LHILGASMDRAVLVPLGHFGKNTRTTKGERK